MRAKTVVLAALLTVPFQVGCDFESFAESSDKYREDFQYSYDLKPGGRVTLETFNGTVEIVSWEKPTVQVTGTKYAANEQDMRDIKIDVQGNGSSVTVRAIRPERRGNMGAKFFLRVPREVELERVVSSNGQIRIEDVAGGARLETSNGQIRVNKFKGQLLARTSNGSVECYGVHGDAQLRTSNGTIRLEDMTGALDAETSNSGINIRMFEPKSDAPVRLQTSNGSIDVAFDALASEVRATTSNSSITLRMPADMKAQLRASTSNGSINSDFDISATSSGKNHIEGSINGGGPLVHATTSNGSIRLYRM